MFKHLDCFGLFSKNTEVVPEIKVHKVHKVQNVNPIQRVKKNNKLKKHYPGPGSTFSHNSFYYRKQLIVKMSSTEEDGAYKSFRISKNN